MPYFDAAAQRRLRTVAHGRIESAATCPTNSNSNTWPSRAANCCSAAAWASARSRLGNLVVGAQNASAAADRSAAAAIAALPGQGQARHPPVHERRAVARRHVRPQAGARPSTPASRCPAARCRPSARPAPRSRRRSSSTSTAKAASKSATSFAHVAESIDDIAVIRSMHADVPNHEPSLLLMNCGDARQIRPSLGSWLCYGLGSENQNLPAFVAMCPGGYPIQETQNWQSGFLPGVYEGTYIDTQHTEDRAADRAHPQRSHLAAAAARAARSAASGSTPATCRPGTTMRPSKPASTRSSWPSACRPKRPRRSTSAASRSTSATCTAPACRPGNC